MRKQFDRASGSKMAADKIARLLEEGASTLTIFGTMAGIESRLGPRSGVQSDWKSVGKYMRRGLKADRERQAS
jgi:hypothetical protein